MTLTTSTDVEKQINELYKLKRKLTKEERQRAGVKPKKVGRKALNVTVEEILKLRAKDMSWDRIADELGCSVATVFNRVSKEVRETIIRRATRVVRKKDEKRGKR